MKKISAILAAVLCMLMFTPWAYADIAPEPRVGSSFLVILASGIVIAVICIVCFMIIRKVRNKK